MTNETRLVRAFFNFTRIDELALHRSHWMLSTAEICTIAALFLCTSSSLTITGIKNTSSNNELGSSLIIIMLHNTGSATLHKKAKIILYRY